MLHILQEGYTDKAECFCDDHNVWWIRIYSNSVYWIYDASWLYIGIYALYKHFYSSKCRGWSDVVYLAENKRL